MDKIDRVDLMCGEHEVALQAPPFQIVLLKPIDPTDFSVGWEFVLDDLECPRDNESDCVDSWEVRPVE